MSKLRHSKVLQSTKSGQLEVTNMILIHMLMPLKNIVYICVDTCIPLLLFFFFLQDLKVFFITRILKDIVVGKIFIYGRQHNFTYQQNGPAIHLQENMKF